MSDGADAPVRAYTVRLELVDEPGELLNALGPIADNGGNLLSIFHERGNVTPRGRIPVEVDLEATPARFERIVEGLRSAGVNVMQAGEERYAGELTVLLVGALVETDLSDTLARFEHTARASVADVSLSVGDEGEPSSARVRLATETDETGEVLARVRELADEKGFTVVEPLTAGGGA